MKSQKGFSAVVILLAIIAMGVVGFTGYYVWNTQNNKKQDNTTPANEITNTTPSTTPAPDTTATYCLKTQNTCFDYPKTWEIDATNSDKATQYSHFANDRVTITSPLGSEISLQTGIDGIGGACLKDDPQQSMSSRVKRVGPSKLGSNYYVTRLINTYPQSPEKDQVVIIKADKANDVPEPVSGTDVVCSYGMSSLVQLINTNYPTSIYSTVKNVEDENQIFAIMGSVRQESN